MGLAGRRPFHCSPQSADESPHNTSGKPVAAFVAWGDHRQHGVIGQRLTCLHLDRTKKLLEVGLELAHGLVTCRYVFGRGFFENALQALGNGRIEGRQRRERFMHDGMHDVHSAFALKWQPSGCHFVDDNTQ